MAIEIATIPTTDTHAALTAKGEAVAALLRFEELFKELEPADRRYFAGELAELAEEATSGE